jgi:hypothetical protein
MFFNPSMQILINDSSDPIAVKPMWAGPENGRLKI